MYSFAAILPWENQQWRRKLLRNITLILAFCGEISFTVIFSRDMGWGRGVDGAEGVGGGGGEREGAGNSTI